MTKTEIIKNKTHVEYSANGFDYLFVQEVDSWWSIYCYHNFAQTWKPLLQSKDLEHCKTYAIMREPTGNWNKL